MGPPQGQRCFATRKACKILKNLRGEQKQYYPFNVGFLQLALQQWNEAACDPSHCKADLSPPDEILVNPDIAIPDVIMQCIDSHLIYIAFKAAIVDRTVENCREVLMRKTPLLGKIYNFEEMERAGRFFAHTCYIMAYCVLIQIEPFVRLHDKTYWVSQFTNVREINLGDCREGLRGALRSKQQQVLLVNFICGSPRNTGHTFLLVCSEPEHPSHSPTWFIIQSYQGSYTYRQALQYFTTKQRADVIRLQTELIERVLCKEGEIAAKDWTRMFWTRRETPCTIQSLIFCSFSPIIHLPMFG